MLKSHFNLQESEIEAVEEEHVPEELKGERETVPVEEEKHDERKLHESEVSVRLSLLGKTADGDSYSYLKATCTGMALTNISVLVTFKHLQYVNVSENFLTLPRLQVLTKLPFLVLIHADKNLIRSAALKRMKYLQVIIMNHNKICSCHDVYQPELSTLELGYNKIKDIRFKADLSKLKCLDLRYNLIREIGTPHLPNLDSLYLAGNKIKTLTGIESLVNLRILHVRNNPIKVLTGLHPGLVRLHYVNFRNCKIDALKSVKKLKVLPALEVLIMKGCPYMGGEGIESSEVKEEEEDDAELRVEVLAAVPRLKRLNKTIVTDEERAEAKELMMQWLEENQEEQEAEEEEEEKED